MSEEKSYMANYMNERYRRRRAEAVFLLGGVCKCCGKPDDGTHEFDHWDPNDKTSTIARMWSASEEKFITELSKCQLLCVDCHKLKSIYERGQVPAQGTHGTLSSYRYCKCALCRKAKSDHSRAQYLKRTSSSVG